MKYSPLALAFLSAVVASGCTTQTSNETPFDLTILHINDHHSHLEPSTQKLKLAGQSTYTEVGGFPALITALNQRTEANENVLKLHAGDAISGTLYYALFKGEADAAMMNHACFDAFALGNHEFDDGDAGLAQFLDWMNEGECSKETEVLAANVIPKQGVSPLAKNSANDYFKPYTVKQYGEHQIGIVGIDIADKTMNSSNPDETTQFLNEVETAQKYIDELVAKGVSNIVLLTHYQYSNDLQLAEALTDVDVIIGGDSHTLLGDFAAVGLKSEGAYPTLMKNKDGDQVCVAQAWQYSQILGELSVSFDGNGKVAACNGTPHLLIGSEFKRKDENGKKQALEGAELAAVMADVEAQPNLIQVKPDAATQQTLSAFTQKLDVMKDQEIAQSSELLCYERVPGQQKHNGADGCDTHTNLHGSQVADLVAQAFLAQTKRADVAIQNGGGARANIPQGKFTVAGATKVLPFSNTMVNLQMTGAEVKKVLNQAVDKAYAEYVDNSAKGSDGAYPYAAGIRYDVDFSRPEGQRVHNVEVKAKGDGSWSKLSDDRELIVVTNDYIAGGKDGYIAFGEVSADKSKYENTLKLYTETFIDYVRDLAANGKKIEAVAEQDRSTQTFTPKAN
ncbi:5'-nucleotidase C-terminal domain-containing protein [Vibrio europaeus]|uniref:5'-nucleotidase C-terminal domain-containing protein n=1 Tax=Vibrio europaeus TaxID=300876 RepID=UPI00233F8DB7|nr:5'-nucleotidase C-terminal domain-containing protein [Vibrio europaeus]MDC5839471.1 5'-nucleotidase C-terminal domain-containing protein [Vibrio europaeus]